MSGEQKEDLVNHPQHYTSHPSGVECADLAEALGFLLGNALKYAWRANLKGSEVQDLEKAAWYLARYEAKLLSDDGSAPMGMPSAYAMVCWDDRKRVIAERVLAREPEGTLLFCTLQSVVLTRGRIGRNVIAWLQTVAKQLAEQKRQESKG